MHAEGSRKSDSEKRHYSKPRESRRSGFGPPGRPHSAHARSCGRSTGLALRCTRKSTARRFCRSRLHDAHREGALPTLATTTDAPQSTQSTTLGLSAIPLGTPKTLPQPPDSPGAISITGPDAEKPNEPARRPQPRISQRTIGTTTKNTTRTPSSAFVVPYRDNAHNKGGPMNRMPPNSGGWTPPAGISLQGRHVHLALTTVTSASHSH